MKPSLLTALTCAVTFSQAAATTFTVTTTADSGPGSLRQAITSANNTAGADVIHFNIPGAEVQTIAPLTAFPDITETLAINGYTQPGSSANSSILGNDAVLRIRLDGSKITSGIPTALYFRVASGSSVRGLVIVRFGSGIQIYDSSNVTIAGNWIGMDIDGLARGMTFDGIAVSSPGFGVAMNNHIGGTNPADRNVISGNLNGVSFFPTTAANNFVLGNFIGTDPGGRLPRGNVFSGVSIQSATNITIGNGSLGGRNIISASTGAGGCGVSIVGGGGHLIQGNHIGTDIAGLFDLGHSADGIFAQGAANLRILSNLVGNNRANGIFFFNTSGSVIEGNQIGTENYTLLHYPLGNAQAGILISGDTNRVGGLTLGQGNTIQFNGGAGVAVTSGERNEITGNFIFDNGGLGIDLGFNTGVTTNDFDDLDTGPNGLQNYPELSSAASAYGTTQVQGQLHSTLNAAFRLEFFASPQFDPDGLIEGQILLGSTNLVTDGSGASSFNLMLPTGTPTNYWVTATATDSSGNTSEFSPGILATTGAASPTLGISVSGAGTETVFWPAAATSYQLESTTSLSPTSQWVVITSGIQQTGDWKQLLITNPASPARQFFRLKR